MKKRLKEYLCFKKMTNLNKKPKYGMKKLSVGLVSCMIGFSILNMNTSYASEKKVIVEDNKIINEKVLGESDNIEKIDNTLDTDIKDNKPTEDFENINENKINGPSILISKGVDRNTEEVEKLEMTEDSTDKVEIESNAISNQDTKDDDVKKEIDLTNKEVVTSTKKADEVLDKKDNQVDEGKKENDAVALRNANTDNSSSISQETADEIKKIEFSDEELLDSLKIRVGSDYVIKAINMSRQEGKVWKDLSKEEKDSYFEKAKTIVKEELVENNLYRERFDIIKNDVLTYTNALNITKKSEEAIKNKKHQFVLGMAYLDKLYNVDVDTKGTTLRDKLLENVTEADKVNGIINIGSQSDQNLGYNQIANLFKNQISNDFSEANNLKTFIEDSVGKDNTDKFFMDNLKVVNYIDDNLEKGIFDRFADNNRLLNHILPLLNLERESIYMIVNDASISYGLYDTYVYDKNKTEEKALEEKVKEVGQAQSGHIKIWKALSNNLIPNRNTVVKDALRIKAKDEDPYTLDTRYTSKNTWAKKYDTVGLREFFTPLNMYSDFINAGAVAESPSDIRMLINRTLDYRGLSAYSHELIHLYNEEYLHGNDTRKDLQPELYPRGLLESFEDDKPVFGLNLIYEGRKWSNSSYKQFFENDNIEDNVKDYMRKQLDLIYSLEIIEGKELLKRNDKEEYLKQLIQEKTDKTQTIDKFKKLDGQNLESIDDLVDNNIVVKRYDYSKRTLDQDFAYNNDYHTIPLFSSFYAASENPDGSVGDVSLRRLSFELLGEFGYEKGLVPYLSNKHLENGKITDKEVLANIFGDKHASMKDFKKAMYKEREEKLSKIKDITFEYDNKKYTTSDIEQLMSEAIEKDKALTNRTINQYAFDSNVNKLKAAIFQAYKKETNDFREDIYKEETKPVERNIHYVRNGGLDNTGGDGSEKNPYQSITNAIKKAKPGDKIVLLEDITINGNDDLTIDKELTIEGQNNTINFRGHDLQIKSNSKFKDLNLAFIPEGQSNGNIYVNDNKVIFDNITTKVGNNPNQNDIRPTLVAGSKDGKSNKGTEANITFANSTSETRFKSMILGNEVGEKKNPTVIKIDNFVKVDGEVILSSGDGSINNSVKIENSSGNVRKFVGGKNTQSSDLTIKNTNIYNLEFDKFNVLNIDNSSSVSLKENQNYELDKLSISEQSKLFISGVNNLKAKSIKISENSELYISPKENILIIDNPDSNAIDGRITVSSNNVKITKDVLSKNIINIKNNQKSMRYKFFPDITGYVLKFVDDGYQLIEDKKEDVVKDFKIENQNDNLVDKNNINDIKIIPEDENAEIIISNLPMSLTYSSDSRSIKGKIEIDAWEDNEENREVEITVTIRNSDNSEVVKKIILSVNRDMDQDGIIDKEDDDIDGDGVLNKDEKDYNTDPRDPNSYPTAKGESEVHKKEEFDISKLGNILDENNSLDGFTNVEKLEYKVYSDTMSREEVSYNQTYDNIDNLITKNDIENNFDNSAYRENSNKEKEGQEEGIVSDELNKKTKKSLQNQMNIKTNPKTGCCENSKTLMFISMIGILLLGLISKLEKRIRRESN